MQEYEMKTFLSKSEDGGLVKAEDVDELLIEIVGKIKLIQANSYIAEMDPKVRETGFNAATMDLINSLAKETLEILQKYI